MIGGLDVEQRPDGPYIVSAEPRIVLDDDWFARTNLGPGRPRVGDIIRLHATNGVVIYTVQAIADGLWFLAWPD